MICSLAEEGARAIGADVDLIRTGSLYHDVGKLHAPGWFIENQKDEPNPHDTLNDPFGSAAVLQAHVDGAKLGQSSTQLFAYEVFVWRVPIMLTTNNWCLDKLSQEEREWVQSNCVAVCVNTPVYVATGEKRARE